MGLFMWGLMGLAAVGAAIAGKPLADATTPDPTDSGFKLKEGCAGVEVIDEPRALDWARKRVASLPASGWELTFIAEVAGPCLAALQDPANTPKFLASVGFLWKLALHALGGAVDSNKLTREAAELRVKNVLEAAAGYGIDPALLTPTTLP